MEHINYYHLMAILFLYAVTQDCFETQSLLNVEPPELDRTDDVKERGYLSSK